ncbi:DUF5134 domain-containing protein (plasmid) [Arthrobacter sp. YA7-1]|uniref:DUF5134 domain-containing protein n=1 Tax=Arthrobacter sp. YA7-1 TaxID=2987701 RepID=UPI0022268201|nr:DUF5134 domain-containing protein [Arthrobacter sp. YA7-1]UYY83627.1 DUF5134 domain-containing protein [Arthrobacter sp. YA7-1]
MITNPVAQWLLCAIFILTGAYSLFRTVKPSAVHERISHGAHALMAAAMAAMIWPWGMSLLLVPQMAVFSLAALWFIYLFAAHPTRQRSDRALDSHHGGRGTLAFHGAMMAAMVAMAAAMRAATSGTGNTPGTGPMASMPGMDMPAHSMASAMATPLWASVLSAACAAGFGIAALFYLGSTLAGATSPHRRTGPGLRATADAAWNLLMATGMAALFLPLVNFG